jgi:transposase
MSASNTGSSTIFTAVCTIRSRTEGIDNGRFSRLHAMIGEQLGEDAEETEVVVGIETDRGPWVRALIAAGYTVFAVNPLSVARYRERHSVSGAKSDAADAHTLADMVRTDSHQLRAVAGDSAAAEAVKVVTRAHKTLIRERTRSTQRLRHALREYFPAALEAFADLDAADTLELLAKAPDPASAAKLTIAEISAALKRARRRNVAEKATRIQARAARGAPGPTRGGHRGLRGHHPRSSSRADHPC